MDELVELLWDRGTVVVQGQSSHPNTNTSYGYKSASFGVDGGSGMTPHETKDKKMLINKDAGTTTTTQILQFDSPEPLLDPDFFSLPGTERTDHHNCDVHVGDVDADTGRVPWIDYSILDTSEHCTRDELPSNLNSNNPPLPPSLPPKAVGIEAAVPVHKSGQDDVLCSVKKPPHLHLEGGGLGVGLVNFSHFLRPVALAEATLQSAERLRSNEKASTSYNNSSRLESIVIQSASTLPLHPAKPSLLSKPQILLPSSHQKEVDTSKHHCDGNNKVPAPSLQPVQRTELDKEKEREKVKEKNVQPEAGAASVCSRNVDPKQKLKRKSLEEDNATNSDEDVQDESVGLTRSSTSKSKGIKRGRSAEVHNLSERRRRDRINEKMKALQELIPNCNKVDKASMLDEAIEYLKTLQLQVQMMMMMGNGMCIPPIMVPPGLHHMPLAPYPQMGIGMGISMGMNMGMGMGMGYGMGAGDINHHPIIRPPPLAPPLNFMPVYNGAVFPFDKGIPPAPSIGPQVERRHINSSNLAQSGEVGVKCTDTSNGETVKSAT